MASLRDLVRERYLDTLRKTRPANSRWKILVVDAFTKKHMNHVMKVYDILEEGVQQIEQLEQSRARNANMEALYIVLPTTGNVDRICQDFYIPPVPQPNKKDKNPAPPPAPQPPKYAAAHIVFVGAVPDELFNRLADRIPEDRLRGVKEIYIQFWPIESHVFSTRSPGAFNKFYAPPRRSAREGVDAAEDELRFSCQSIVNNLVLLGEYPLIRYYNPTSKPLGVGVAYNEHITRRLAEMVQREMDEYCRNNSDFPPKPEPPRARGVLFITDRSIDLMAPLLHEFTYQAMINDLLDVEDDGTRYHHTFRNNMGVMEEKDVELTEEDEIWLETRHMHMKDCLDKLVADFQKYAGDYNQKFGGDAKGSINDMKDMLASLDSTRKNKDSLSAHLSLAEKCMAYFEKYKLPLVAEVEQSCATGLTPEGKAPKTLVEDMVPLLGDRALSSKDKVRIIALYILYRNGVPEEDRKRLFQHAHLALHEMDMVNNIKYLGLDISKELKSSRKQAVKQRQLEDVYDISRYQPVVKLMLDEHVVDRLDQSTFPYVKDAPHSTRNSNASTSSQGAPASLRSSRPQWAERAKTRTVKEPKQRLVIFQLGGMTYSEIRSVYQVSSASNRDVFIGSSHIITPKTFLQELSDLEKGGGASMAAGFAPDAARYDKYRELNKHDKTPRMTPQEGFDRRFPYVSSSSSRPSGDRQPSHNNQIPPVNQPPQSQRQGNGPSLHLQPVPQQQQQQIPSPSRPMSGQSMPSPRPGGPTRQLSARLLHPTRPAPGQNAQSYDANFNPIPSASSQSSRTPSIASFNSSSAAPDQGKGEKEKKKKNILKKMF